VRSKSALNACSTNLPVEPATRPAVERNPLSQRANRLLQATERQISELGVLIATGGDAGLRRACPSREKLGDATVPAVVLHTASSYRRIAAFVRGDGGDGDRDAADHDPHVPQTIMARQLRDELTAAQVRPPAVSAPRA
jgi:hypothetical protein